MKLFIQKVFIPLFLLTGCGFKPQDSKLPLVVVSIAPYAYFTKQIAGNTVQIKTLIPDGYNPHIYEGSPGQLTGIEKAALWIGLGEPFEEHLLQSIQEKNRSLISLNLTKTVPLIDYDTEEKHFDWCNSAGSHDHETIDRHIWMSPSLAKLQAQAIYNKLVEIAPSHKPLYIKNLQLFLQKLDSLDNECKQLLAPMAGSAFIISHPSLDYFCKEYQLIQIPIECEGKSPLPKDLSSILQISEKFNVRCALTQPQFDNRATLLIAKKLHISVNEIDPYDYDYLENIKKIATIIKQCPSSQ